MGPAPLSALPLGTRLPKPPSRRTFPAFFAFLTFFAFFVFLFRVLRIIIEARENKGFVCTEEVWGYCTLTNEIDAGGYLYLFWYSKGNLGSVCLVAD